MTLRWAPIAFAILIAILLCSGSFAFQPQPASAQVPPVAVQTTPFTDRYINAEAGIEMNIPHGWVGREADGFASASPAVDNSTGQPPEPVAMAILPLPRSAFENATFTGPQGLAGAFQEYLLKECSNSGDGFLTINRIELLNTTFQCPSPMKVKELSSLLHTYS